MDLPHILQVVLYSQFTSPALVWQQVWCFSAFDLPPDKENALWPSMRHNLVSPDRKLSPHSGAKCWTCFLQHCRPWSSTRVEFLEFPRHIFPLLHHHCAPAAWRANSQSFPNSPWPPHPWAHPSAPFYCTCESLGTDISEFFLPRKMQALGSMMLSPNF